MSGRAGARYPPVQSLTQIADALGVSETAVSTAARLLLQAGIVERVSEPGRRGDYYRSCSLHPDAMLHLDHVKTMGRLIRRCLQLVADKDQTQSNCVLLRETSELVDFFEAEIPGRMERWRVARATKAAVTPGADDTLERGGTT